MTSTTQDAKASRTGIANLCIRSVQSTDAQGLVDLYSLPRASFGDFVGPHQSLEAMRVRMEQSEKRRWLVATVDDRLIGTSNLTRQVGRRDHVAVIGITVHDEWTGRGVGTALMEAIIDLAENWLGLRRLELAVVTTNASAIALYERMGFRIEGTHRAYLMENGALIDAHTMARIRSAVE